MHNYLELQLLNVGTGCTVADLMNRQLRDLVCEDLEESPTLTTRCSRTERPRLLRIIVERVEKSIPFDSEKLKRQIYFIQ